MTIEGTAMPTGTVGTGTVERVGIPGAEPSPAAVDLYQWLARGELPRLPQDAAALKELEEKWGLVKFDPAAPDLPVLMSPREAGWRHIDASLRVIADLAARLATVPAAADLLTQAYERSRWRSGPGSEFIDDPTVVNARIDDLLSQAKTELLSAHPGGPRTRDDMRIAVDRDTDALARGVQIRTLYLDPVRDDAVTCEWATTMTGRGAHFRTLVSPFEKVIVVDRTTAVISNYVVPDAPERAAWIVTDRALVAFIAMVFEGEWRRADVWHGERRTGRNASEARTTPLQRDIMRALAVGVVQETAARNRGISLRRLQRELDALRKLWNVRTLAELIYQWALSPDHQIPDHPTAGTPERERAAQAEAPEIAA